MWLLAFLILGFVSTVASWVTMFHYINQEDEIPGWLGGWVLVNFVGSIIGLILTFAQ